MDWRDIALIGAGIIGAGVALVHGALTQRHMVRPIGALLAADRRSGPMIGRLTGALLQFSTFNWFLGGLALIAAALWMGPEARLVTSLLVGGAYLFAVIGNGWATRGRHPGWMLYSLALVLIALGAVKSGG